MSRAQGSEQSGAEGAAGSRLGDPHGYTESAPSPPGSLPRPHGSPTCPQGPRPVWKGEPEAGGQWWEGGPQRTEGDDLKGMPCPP